MHRIANRAAWALPVMAMLLAGAAAAQTSGPEWVEGNRGTGDAGSLPADAQQTQGKGPMMGIQGELGLGVNGGDFEDMYIINIEEPTKFTVSTDGDANFDTSLWLFQEIFFGKGGSEFLGLLANQDIDANNPFSKIGQFATDDTENFVAEPGIYYLAITRQGNVPLSDGEIFFFADPFEISGNDGQGGQFGIEGWSGDDGGSPGTATYRIEATGVGFADLPAPGVLPAVIIAGLLARRRRR